LRLGAAAARRQGVGDEGLGGIGPFAKLFLCSFALFCEPVA